MEKLRTKEVAIKGLLYTYYLSSEGTHPVRLKVTANRSSRFYPVQYEGKNLFMKRDRWDKLHEVDKNGKSSAKGENRKILDRISDVESLARKAKDKVMQNNRSFDFARFESEFLHQESEKGILSLWQKYIDDLKSEGRAGTYIAYKNALQAFMYFRGLVTKRENGKTVITKNPVEIKPENITVQLLKDFDAFLVKRGCGRTTIGMYIRSLKVIFNVAADDNPSLKEFYPFAVKQNDKGKYKIKTGSGSKGITLSLEQLQQLMSTTPTPTTPEYIAKQLWLFSFYAQGMNFKDLALLKYQDIKGETISYIRHKTKDTQAEEDLMELPLSEPMKQIIIDIGNPDKSRDAYIFNIVPKKEDDVIKIDAIIRQKIKITNKWLKSLCEDNDLPVITGYAARHSYANLLKQSGESTEVIRELLGHSDMRTTEAYLKRFDFSKKLKISDKIQAILKAS